jgi:AraC-like DNA-binding protein
MKGQRGRNSVREERRIADDRQELVERLAGWVPKDGPAEPQPGIQLYRCSAPTEPVHSVSEPAFCVVAQGSKQVFMGEDRFQYDPAHYLLASVELPTVSQVLAASEEKPYLGLRLVLDPTLVASVLVEAGQPSPSGSSGVKALDVSPLDGGLLDASLRLVRFLDSPTEYRVLAPLVMREIVYRLLMGQQGARLRLVAALGGQAHRIARAVERLRKDYDKPLRIEGLARELGMSVSGFHQHFKSVTSLSPLQFQKQLRLQEARRLMLTEDLDAAGAGFRVGYEDASQFNREYRRLFGGPPIRDVERLREATKTGAAMSSARYEL